MKKQVILTLSFFILIFLIVNLILSAIPGEFTISNTAPTVSNFGVRESDGSWDSAEFTTHNSNTELRWTANDINRDDLTTIICIGTNPNPYSSLQCNVANYQLATVAEGTAQTYAYNTDPIGTLQGIADTINFQGSDCSAPPCVKSYYADIVVRDGTDETVSSHSFSITDYLPTFSNVYISDSPLTIPDDSCTDYLPQHCLINPTPGELTSINAVLAINDLDEDCSDVTHTASAILCMVDAGGAELCDNANNADYSYLLSFSSKSGPNCNFGISIPVGNPQGVEFFKLPGIYKMHLEANSQAGPATGFPANPEWEYGSLPAPLFPSQIFLGDRTEDGGDGIQLGSWNPGLSKAAITNQGNVILNLNWEATDPSSDLSVCSGNTNTCWDLSTADDLQIDDDNIAEETIETGLTPANIPETPAKIGFNPIGGLKLCTEMTCSTASGETLDTYFHIKPPIGLGAGTYRTDLTVTTL